MDDRNTTDKVSQVNPLRVGGEPHAYWHFTRRGRSLECFNRLPDVPFFFLI